MSLADRSTPGSTDPATGEVLAVKDAGYDVVRWAWLLDDLPVILVGRPRSDRAFYARAGRRRGPDKGRPPRHGEKLVLRDPATHLDPVCATEHALERNGTVQVRVFGRCIPKSTRAAGSGTIKGSCP